MGCVSTRVSFSQAREGHTVWELAPLQPRQEFCHRQLDPQQLIARLRQHAWTNHMNFENFAILQLVHMTFVNLQLMRMTFVNLQLVRITLVNLLLVLMTFVNLQLVRTTFVNLQLVSMTFVSSSYA